MKKGLAAAVALAATVMAAAALAAPALGAETFTVNSVGDEPDFSLSDLPNTCDSAPDPAVARCTLRAAIQEANATAGSDRIHFGLAGPGVRTIAPGPTDLPSLTQPVVIDGYTQPGTKRNRTKLGRPLSTRLRIQLDGRDAQGSGLRFVAGSADSVVRGLVINHWDDVGIRAGLRTVIEGNFIGTNARGTAARPNDFGVGPTGAFDPQDDIVIGGAEPVERNLISGNSSFAIGLNGSARIRGNYIGTAADGRAPLGNRDDAIALFDSTAPNAVVGNVIANNAGSAVALHNQNPGTPIRRNSIYRNRFGIDLANDGLTPNDPGDIDTGPNGRQNFPVVKTARWAKRRLRVRASLRSAPNARYLIEFFSTPRPQRQGRTFIGRERVSPDAAGKVAFAFKRRGLRRGRLFITATATALDAGDGATSEFSAPRRVKSRR
jgi:CSLREA domain-containing protein